MGLLKQVWELAGCGLVYVGVRMLGYAPSPPSEDEDEDVLAQGPAVRFTPEATNMIRDGMQIPPPKADTTEAPLAGSARARRVKP